jgi:hypothetical protein
MKNTLELQLRALRPPRVLKQNDAGDPELIDVWAMHHEDSSSRQFAIAVKFGREIVRQATELKTGTLFTVQGRLDQNRNPATGIYHTFVLAEAISDLVHSKKSHAQSPGPDIHSGQHDEAPELDLPEIDQNEQNPEPEIPHA